MQDGLCVTPPKKKGFIGSSASRNTSQQFLPDRLFKVSCESFANRFMCKRLPQACSNGRLSHEGPSWKNSASLHWLDSSITYFGRTIRSPVTRRIRVRADAAVPPTGGDRIGRGGLWGRWAGSCRSPRWAASCRGSPPLRLHPGSTC
ncbi:hypothetical protein VP01_3749g3 [Puccinia sorghi]|uniref:Uncharacterized protein n=1 Tax=Puccinia sorghi TaxID=27349 RepID=A0A0L6UVS7_9BASI|nr:hypothetical protein VP01_3749g3 [Puccinia sorghi]